MKLDVNASGAQVTLFVAGNNTVAGNLASPADGLIDTAPIQTIPRDSSFISSWIHGRTVMVQSVLVYQLSLGGGKRKRREAMFCFILFFFVLQYFFLFCFFLTSKATDQQDSPHLLSLQLLLPMSI